MTSLRGVGVRIVLIGTGAHSATSILRTVPAVHATLYDLQDVLIDRCGVTPDNITVVHDPAGPQVMIQATVQAAKQAEEVLVVYYVGHGVVSSSGNLFLATSGTEQDSDLDLMSNSLDFDHLRKVLQARRSGRVVVILDCCYSGRAANFLSSETEFTARVSQFDGGVVLTASGRNELALAPEGSRHTAFSGELIQILRNGESKAGPTLTLKDVAAALKRNLLAKRLPEPRTLVGQGGDALVLCDNPAYSSSSDEVADDERGTPFVDDCPYPGLTAFQQADAPWFFGRDREIDDLLSAVTASIANRHGTVLLGASGAGKSSLLRAGLLPAIARGRLALPGASSWPVVLMTPTATPTQTLTEAIGAVNGWDPAVVWQQAGRDPVRIVALVRELLRERGEQRPGDSRLLLIVDQFEALFTSCPQRAEQERFAATLAALNGDDDTDAVAAVVVALRSDFFSDATEFTALDPALRHGQVLVGSLSAAELKSVVVGPAAAVGLNVQPGLAEILSRDAGAVSGSTAATSPATLPLLAHALRLTWDRRAGRMLTIDGYEATGGVAGALAKSAEDVYTALRTDQRETAERIFIRLVQLSDNTGDTRRRESLRGLISDLPDAAAVLDAFAAARLITLDADGVELTHEALIGAWKRLRTLIDADRLRLLQGQRLAVAAAAWRESGDDSSFLLGGARLAELRSLATTYGQPANLTQLAQEFLTASLAREGLLHRLSKRRRRIGVGLACFAAVVVLGASGVVWWAVQSTKTEAERLRVSASREASAASSALRATQPREALLLAVAAWQIEPTTEARSALLSTQSQPFSGVLGPVDPHGTTASMAVDRHDDRVAIARRDSIEVWDLPRRQLTATLPTKGTANDLAFTNDDQHLVARDSTGLRMWDVRTGVPSGSTFTQINEGAGIVVDPATGAVLAASGTDIWSADPASHTASVRFHPSSGALTALAMSQDGQLLAAVAQQGDPDRIQTRLVLIKTASGTVVRGSKAAESPITSLAVSADGSTVATGHRDGGISTWNGRNGELLAWFAAHDDAVTAVRFSPDSSRVATASLDRSVRLWTVADHRALGEPLQAYGEPVYELAFTTDGHTLLSGGRRTIVWNLNRRPQPLHNGAINAVVVRPGGRQIATAGADGTVSIWDVASRNVVLAIGGHTGGAVALAYTDDGAALATADGSGTVRLLNATAGYSDVTPPVTDAPGVRALAVEGTRVATAHRHDVSIWETTNGSKTDVSIPDTFEGPFRLAYHALGAILTVTGHDQQIEFDVRSNSARGEPTATVVPPGAALVVRAPNTDLRATVNADEMIRLWDLNGHLLATLSGHRNVLLDAAFGDDRHELATGDRDGTLMLWDTDPDRVAIEICDMLHSDLSEAEWNTYITDERPARKVCH